MFSVLLKCLVAKQEQSQYTASKSYKISHLAEMISKMYGLFFLVNIGLTKGLLCVV